MLLAASPSPGERDDEMWVSHHTGSATEGLNPQLSHQRVCLQTVAMSSCAPGPAPLGRGYSRGCSELALAGWPTALQPPGRGRGASLQTVPGGAGWLIQPCRRSVVGLVKALTSANQITVQMQGPWELSLPGFLAGKLEQRLVCGSHRGWLCKIPLSR